ncbi:predicted protein [Coccidioides posadasii str. Silveira]|uniref:Predicted protein n=1 Tax=Coccidioides posadasii (strain RMSCC 757 / Silveira) TaxID=443226 RepID=E9CZV8_COCPS|nr:predicted protein [Coccidioides posadasii str. Silveira]
MHSSTSPIQVEILGKYKDVPPSLPGLDGATAELIGTLKYLHVHTYDVCIPTTKAIPSSKMLGKKLK